MKLIHLSDLHLGKRLNGFSMLEDQKYILDKILNIIDVQSPDAVVIAGDVYDKTVPTAEAVGLFDSFLCALSRRRLHTFVISGNHDSAERIAFGSRLMDGSGVHMSPVCNGAVTPVTLADEYGEINIYMLPFIRPANVRRFFPEAESYTDAVGAVIGSMGVDESARNILITHQFVTGAGRSESEEISVGGADNVDASVFEPFDYVALGHIHRQQSVASERLHYCGTPLKYSFSESNDQKSVTLVELRKKGELSVSLLPLTPLRDMRRIKGSFDELTAGGSSDDYLDVILTDEQDIPDAINRLRDFYPNIMSLDYDNTRTRALSAPISAPDADQSPLQLFEQLYEKQNGQPMDGVQRELVTRLIDKIKEDML